MIPDFDFNYEIAFLLHEMLSFVISYVYRLFMINPLRANPTKWSKILKQFFGNLPTNCFSMFDDFVELAFKGLRGNERIYVSLKLFIKTLIARK